MAALQELGRRHPFTAFRLHFPYAQGIASGLHGNRCLCDLNDRARFRFRPRYDVGCPYFQAVSFVKDLGARMGIQRPYEPFNDDGRLGKINLSHFFRNLGGIGRLRFVLALCRRFIGGQVF